MTGTTHASCGATKEGSAILIPSKNSAAGAKSRAGTQTSAEDRASKTTDSGEVWGSNPHLRTERRGTRPPPRAVEEWCQRTFQHWPCQNRWPPHSGGLACL